MNADSANSQLDLNIIEIASPCSVDWTSMEGTDKVRFCGQCELSVYNVAAMTKEEARQRIESKEGRVCVRLYRRKDGTVVTKDCSVVVLASRWGRAGLYASVSLLLLLLTGGGIALAAREKWSQPRLFFHGPLATLQDWLNPDLAELGDVMMVPAPVPAARALPAAPGTNAPDAEE